MAKLQNSVPVGRRKKKKMVAEHKYGVSNVRRGKGCNRNKQKGGMRVHKAVSISVYQSVSTCKLHTDHYAKNPLPRFTHLNLFSKSQIKPTIDSDKQDARRKSCGGGEKLASDKWPV